MTNMKEIKEIPASAGTDSYRMTNMKEIKEIPASAGTDSYRMTNMKEIKEIPASAGIAIRNTALVRSLSAASLMTRLNNKIFSHPTKLQSSKCIKEKISKGYTIHLRLCNTIPAEAGISGPYDNACHSREGGNLTVRRVK
jgi:hypothetical protein